MGLLAGQKVLVTGASAGIGAGIARRMAAEGAVVGICARRRDRLEEVLADCRAHSPDSRMWVVDLSDLDAVDRFAAEADTELGGVDVLVNNAGIPKRRHVRDLTPGVVEAVMSINYFSPIRLTLALLPGMLERDHGHIVNISSIAGRLGPPREAAYSSTKAALTAWSESMAVDLDALPVEAVADAVVRQLEEGTFEIFVPEWFKDVVAGKASDSGLFLEGSKAWVRQRLEQLSQS